MNIPKEELISILIQFNPWWRKERIPDLPAWKRAAFKELLEWVVHPPAHRAIMVSGPRQVGKTTLLLQTISQLISDGTPAKNILYVTFDHPVFKLAGLEAILEAWRELEPKANGPEFLFLDEAQFIRDFGTWVKHQIDFGSKERRIVFTGSAVSLIDSREESGVGRWYTLKISTLSFYEYLQIKKISFSEIPKIELLSDLFKSPQLELSSYSEANQKLIAHFHEYLIRGGFPQTALVESIPQAQRLLREDIIDKVLKRDMTAIFGVRRILELEETFIYLCIHDGGIQDLATLSKNLGVPKQTVQNFINLLMATHVLFRLAPFGYGKEILRARYKLYLADPAMASAILMRGKNVLEDPKALGGCVETAAFAHLSAHTIANHIRFSYWKDPKNNELDLILELAKELIPIEVKYHSQRTTASDIQGLINFCIQKEAVEYGYVLTKESKDIGKIEKGHQSYSAQIMRIPAAIFCYWLGEAEIHQKNILYPSNSGL